MENEENSKKIENAENNVQKEITEQNPDLNPNQNIQQNEINNENNEINIDENNNENKKELNKEENNNNEIEKDNKNDINQENKELNKKENEKIKEDNNENLDNKENNEKNENNNIQDQQVIMQIVQPEVNSSSEIYNKTILEFPKDFIDDKIRCNTLTQKLIKKTQRNANMKFEDFFKKKRNYLIMTDGGKPVYSRYGDEVENNSIFATFSAMITKFTIFNSNNNYKEELNVISNKKNKIVFMKKGQLIFIAFSKKINDTVSLLHSQLEFIYNQLMSILTSKFYEKLEDNPSKCLTAMGGTENLFEQIIQYSSNSFISIFNSYQIMNFENFGESHDKLTKILEENKGNSLYCILMTPYEIITFVKSNQITVQASDLILIQNLILCTEMLRTQESYVPICLPGISDQGFLQLYSHFSEENIGIIFVTENLDPMCFMEFQKKYKDIYDRILEGYSEKIIQCMRKNNNMKGKFCLFKNKNTEENIDKEALINKLITKINLYKFKQRNEMMANEGKNSSNKLPSVNNLNNLNNLNLTNKDLTKVKTFVSAKTISINNNLKSTDNTSVFNEIKYGVVLNRKYNQYIMLNFGMDYRTYTKEEKELIMKYIKLYDIFNNYKEKDKDKEEFFYIEKCDKYYNLIQVNEYFVIIFSFGFFSDIDKIQKKAKDILKHLKKFENKYFILYK